MIRPSISAPWLRVSPSIVKDDTLFPEPDSPTIPSVCPSVDRVRDPVDGVHDPVLGREPDAKVLDLQQWLAHEYRTLGSRYAYPMSTTRLKKTMKNAPNSVMPWIVVRSDTLMAL